MTPLNPSKRVETAKNACCEADFGLFFPCSSHNFRAKWMKLGHIVDNY